MVYLFCCAETQNSKSGVWLRRAIYINSARAYTFRGCAAVAERPCGCGLWVKSGECGRFWDWRSDISARCVLCGFVGDVGCVEIAGLHPDESSKLALERIR